MFLQPLRLQLKTVSFFWACDLFFLGKFPAVGISAVKSAANYCAADDCNLDNFSFAIGVSLKETNKDTGCT